ncbi:MAG: hypothetical protein H7Y32_13405 [Chloroflexales bacterium]|nr:hypothetical protein [Chloroflexales bacterium]
MLEYTIQAMRPAEYTIQAMRPAWQARVIAAYQHETPASAVLAARIERLTGQAVAPATIFSDPGARVATVVIDGVLFRLDHQRLVVVRACDGCGVAQIESASITSAADLGYALGTWEPRCPHCPIEDPAGWLEQEA